MRRGLGNETDDRRLAMRLRANFLSGDPESGRATSFIIQNKAEGDFIPTIDSLFHKLAGMIRLKGTLHPSARLRRRQKQHMLDSDFPSIGRRHLGEYVFPAKNGLVPMGSTTLPSFG